MIQYFKDYKKQVFPAFCMILFVAFTITDSCTTYLVDPNLENDGNPVVLFFQWGWIETWVYVFCLVLLTLFLAVKSNKYILKYFENKKQGVSSNKFLFGICCLLLIYCYHNLIAPFECSIHNYLCHQYYTRDAGSENFVQNIATHYAEFCINFGITIYYFITVLEILIAAIATIFQVKRVKKYIYSIDTDL